MLKTIDVAEEPMKKTLSSVFLGAMLGVAAGLPADAENLAPSPAWARAMPPGPDARTKRSSRWRSSSTMASVIRIMAVPNEGTILAPAPDSRNHRHAARLAR